MKKFLSYFVPSLALLLVFMAIGTGLAGSSQMRKGLMCKSMTINVKTDDDNCFVSEEDVRRIISREYGGCVNRPLDSLRPGKIEKILLDCAYIKDCQSWCTDDGVLHVDVSHFKALASYCNDGKIWYLCENGSLYPQRMGKASPLLRIEGRLQAADPGWMRSLAGAVEELRGNDVEKLVCRPDGEIDLYMKGRPEVFDIGRPQSMDVKLRRLKTYLTRIDPSGAKAYSSVCLKYRGQVVCK